MTHLVGLASGWSLWRWTCLRAAGFPAQQVLELADAPLAAAADRRLDEEAELARARATLITECNAALERTEGDVQQSVRQALKRLWKHRIPEPLAEDGAELARRRLADAATRLSALDGELIEHYRRAHHAASVALRRAAQDDRFRQAVLWQNRSALTTGIDGLLRQPITATDSRTRQNEQLIASYLQRYCVKNDTIGFFGPVGWARFVEADALVQRPGASLVTDRTIYYEYWAIDALASRLGEDPDLRPFLAPRRLPQFRLDGTTLHYPIGRTAELSAELAAVLALCDGVRTARGIAGELAGRADLALAGEPEVFAALDELADAGAIRWAFEIPTGVTRPERFLAAQLARVEDVEARRRSEQLVDELDRHRAAVAAARSAAELAAALGAFGAAFTAATGSSSHREHGRTYAARTPLYEDCRRDLELEIGGRFLDELGPPLELLLASARWFTYEIAARYREALEAIYRRLCAGGSVVDFDSFWRHVPALFPGAGAANDSIVADVRRELQRRWAMVLAVARDERVVQRRASALAGGVRRYFAAPGPGWPAARHHSPDVLIAARGGSLEADRAFIVGELHTGFNTVSVPLFVKQHPSPGELIAARDADLDRVCIAPVWSRAVTRGDYYSLSPRDLDLESGDTRSARPREQVLSTSDLVIDHREGHLEVRTRDASHRFDIIAFLEHHLIAESFSAFSPIAPAAFTPRVSIDNVVIARATWRIAPAELAWPALEDPVARFVGARRWARQLGLPRWVFVKTPEEVKPVYVDFDSATFVEMLAKQLRRASAASLSEMMPTIDEAWLLDADGARYTAELRIAAVDPEPWRAPGEPGAASR